MSIGVNRVFLAGNLGRDPEPGRTRDGKPSLKLRVATNRAWRDPDGTRHEDTDWHTVKVYGPQAETCGRYLERGRQVLVEGRLHTYSWEDERHERRTATEVVASSVHFLGGRPADGGPAAADDDDGPPTRPRTDLEVAAPAF